MSSLSLSVVVPVYDEGQNIKIFLRDLSTTLAACKVPFEIIAIDDGSQDGSFREMSSVSDVQIIRHSNNRGYGAALKTGILRARYDHILIIDADGTYPLDHVAQLIQRAAGCDMVVGARIGARVHHSWLKRLAKWPIHQLANYLVQYKIPDLNSGLRIFRKELAIKYIRLLPNGFSFTTNITLALLADGYHVVYVPINYDKRHGRSKVRPLRDGLNYFVLVLRMILFYNPLKIFLPVSLVFLVASIASFLYDIVALADLTEKTLILFVTFVQVMILGLLADLINKRGYE